jgi:hypothetical protein
MNVQEAKHHSGCKGIAAQMIGLSAVTATFDGLTQVRKSGNQVHDDSSHLDTGKISSAPSVRFLR